MSKPQELDEIKQRAVLAEQVISNPVFKQAFLAIKAELMLSFESTKPKQKDEREEIWRQTQVVNKIQKQLEGAMKTGKLTSINSQNRKFF